MVVTEDIYTAGVLVKGRNSGCVDHMDDDDDTGAPPGGDLCSTAGLATAAAAKGVVVATPLGTLVDAI